jgi:hypothetical protein
MLRPQPIHCKEVVEHYYSTVSATDVEKYNAIARSSCGQYNCVGGKGQR